METINVKRLNRILSILYSEMKELTDEDRDLPIRWNMMHMYTSTQMAKLIAIKRGLDPELAGLIAAMHDIAVVKTKRRKNHAKEAKEFIIELINLYNSKKRGNLPIINHDEKEIILIAVTQHSEKEMISDHPYVELMKDVDSLDRYLHGIETKEDYLKRCIKVYDELKLKN